MPANRSRTFEWRRCLRQVFERNGAIEIAIYNDDETDGEIASHLLWRVKLLGLTETEILVESPCALGHDISIQPGVEFAAIFSIGQNRWMFRTTNLGMTTLDHGSSKFGIKALRLELPKAVQRCQRRNFYRVATASLSLPGVEVWPLLDPKSVIVAERANELMFDQHAALSESNIKHPLNAEELMPEVGPCFRGTLLNLGGGGIGLQFNPDASQSLARHKVFWIRFNLGPEIGGPICATAKLVHTHVEASQHVYAGMAFDFSFNPAHQKFIVDQISRYIAIQQRMQLQDVAPAAPQRKTA